MNLVKFSKHRLQKMRDEGWESLLGEVFLFCDKHHIIVPNMLDLFVIRGRSRRNVIESTNLHHYRVEVFNAVIDMQLQELNNQFNEVNTELLLCMACLSPADSFSAFDKRKLIQFAEFYKSDFSPVELATLDFQLENYILDVRSESQFFEIKEIGELAKKMIQLKRNKTIIWYIFS